MSADTELKNRICVALDYNNTSEALALIDKLGDRIEWYKVGKELFTSEGVALVKEIVARGKKVFLDLKYHDIPNTVAGAVYAASQLGVSLITIHTLGGRQMMAGAVQALQTIEAHKRPRVIGITILTSHSESELANDFGIDIPIRDMALKLALLAKRSGLDGVVCSAEEAREIRKFCGDDFWIVTPGIRLKDGDSQDQSRVVTPKDALMAGSNLLVMGRPITRALNSKEALDLIAQNLVS